MVDMERRILCLIKPDAVAANRIGAIVDNLEARGFKVIQMRMETWSEGLAKEFYDDIKDKWYFERNVEFMTSGPVVAMLLERENAIEELRRYVGATDPKEANPGTLRGKFGTELPRNAVHASDSPEAVSRESHLIFGEM
jgi:nucleoside-diphosphate kinase